MLCENCNERQATYHVVEMTDGKKHEIHLCEECAQERKLSLPPSLSLNEILSSLMEAHADKDVPELTGITCPNCSMTYAQFKRAGRLGCAKDYEVFSQGLLPFIERIQGTTQHKGKTPKRKGTSDSLQAAELLRMRRELNAAVANEQYELAASLRDKIRNLSKQA